MFESKFIGVDPNKTPYCKDLNLILTDVEIMEKVLTIIQKTLKQSILKRSH